MRRIAQILAVACAVAGMALTALPASAGAQARGGLSQARSDRAASAPTAAQRQAAERARRLLALRGQRGAIAGLVRGPNGAPEANVCVMATGPLATRRAFTRPDGQFLITGLPRGAYRVEFRACSSISRFVGQWYGGQTRKSATKVLVTGAAPVRIAPVTLGTIAARFAHPATAPHPLNPAQRASRLIRTLKSGADVQASARARDLAHISGRVASRAGRPLAHVCVFAAHARDQEFGFLTRTSATGRYRLRVRPGHYLVDFLPFCAPTGNFAPRLWKNAASVRKATVLRVTANQDIRHIDAVLGAGAVITGRVRTRQNPHPSLGGLCVFALGTAGQRLFFGSAVTRADGRFRMPSLATGKYHILIMSGCSRRASPYLPARLRNPVAVTEGKITSGVTAFVKLGGTITGMVRDANGKPLSGICVETFGQQAFSFAITGAAGTYRLAGLRAGSYEVDFVTGCGNRGPYAPQEFPSLVTVRLGKTTPHVSVVLPFDGSLTGLVTNSHGKPLGGICVVAVSSGFGFVFTRTHDDGTYTAKRVPPGNYQVEFIPGGSFFGCGNRGNYLPVSHNATVSSQVTSTVNAVLPTGGIITGVARDPHGKPLAGVCVFSSADFGSQTVTGSDGSYRLRQLATDSYFVGFAGGCGNRGSVAPQAYPGDPTFFGPALVPVTAGQVTSGIDASLRPGGTVTGRITDRAGRPVSGVCVVALAATGGGGGFGGFGGFAIDRNGRYRITNLPPGRYAAFFSGLFSRRGGCSRSPYADQQFNTEGIGGPLSLVTVPGGKTTTGVNAVLSLAGTIKGVARNKAGRPVFGICVTATDPRTGTTGQGFSEERGKYSIAELPAGRYQVEFSSCGGDFAFFGISGLNYANQWYKDHPNSAAADPVAVRPAHTTAHIDAALTRGGSISGQVVYRPTQRPVSFECVFAYTPDFANLSFGLTDRRGRYLVDGLSTGRYIVEFDPCSGESALAGQVRAGRVRLVAGRAVRGVNEQVHLAGSVSGTTRVRLPHGRKPAPGTCVLVLPLSQTASANLAISAEHGDYTVANLAPGQYQIVFGDPECSSDAPAVSQRTSPVIQVTSGKTTTGVDTILAATGAIAGVVRGPGGNPIAGICVEAMRAHNLLGIPAAVTAAAGGRYRIADLQPGRYKVEFISGCGASGFATRWYKNARTRQAAAVVRVKAAAVSTGINVSLPRG